MRLKNYNIYFFFLILAGITVLTYFIAQPFLVPFLVAAILAYLFSPVYDFFLRQTKKRGLSSFLACLLIALLILIPIFLVAFMVVNEIQNLLDNLSYNPYSFNKTLDDLSYSLTSLPLAKFFGIKRIISGDVVVTLTKSLSENALRIFQSLYRSVAHFAFVIFILFFSLFYLFIDGKKLVRKAIELSPLRDKYDQLLIEKFSSIVRATIKGTLLIAMLQGFLGGLLFWATGVSSPIMLGILMTISSVIPSVGSGLVWLPVGVIMLLLGHFLPGLIILLLGALVISTVDNFIRPKLVGRDTQLHPLLILFSSVGGIMLFGVSGFLAGPIVMSLFVAMWDIYALEFKDQLAEYNES